MLKFICLFLYLNFTALNLWAASCCGSSQAFPSLILGDEKAQAMIGYSQSRITDDALASGKWLRREDQNRTDTVKIESAFLLTDRFQMGITLPVAQKSNLQGENTWHLADTSLVLADETWPEKYYSWWRPKGVSYLQLLTPTGDSLYDSPEQSFLTTRGRGFWTLGIGAAFVKRLPKWDFFANTELHHAWGRAGNSSIGEPYTAKPGWGTSQNIGVGLSFDNWRLGGTIGLVYEEPIIISGSVRSDGTLQRFTTAGATLSYMWSDSEGLTLSWSDQTLLGAPVNSSLSESIALSYSHRWLR